MTIIDAWMQHPTPDFVAQPMFDALRRWLGLTTIPDSIPIELTLGAMDAAGVDVGVLCAWWGPSGAMIPNDTVAEVIARAPERFVGLASVNLARPMEGVRELRRCVNELGFRGLRLLPWLWNLPPNDRLYYPLYAACVDLDVPFCLQVGHTGPLCPSEPGRPIPYLDQVALDFPELTIVAGHVGFPWTNEMISLARKYPNVYIDTSAYKPSRFPPELVAYMQQSGCKKVLFGSNFPMIMPGDSLSQLDQIGLDDDARERFVYANAHKIFGINEAEPISTQAE